MDLERNRMMEALITTEKKELFEVLNNHLCPTCKKEVMVPVDRVQENGVLFVWYECKDNTCGGQWLDKKPLYGKGA